MTTRTGRDESDRLPSKRLNVPKGGNTNEEESGEYSAEAEYTGAGFHTFTGLTNGVEYSVGVDAEYNSEYSVGYEDYETPNGALKITGEL